MLRNKLIMGNNMRHTWLVAALVLVFGACESGSDTDDMNPDGDGDIASYSASGTVVDFVTGEVRAGSATISVNGIEPAPTVSVSGADFTLDGVPPHSVFNLLAGSPPSYRSTYNVATTVEDADINGITLSVVSESYLSSLATDFNVNIAAGSTVLISQLIDDTGAPQAGIPASAFDLPANILGPFFLDENRLPAANLNATSSSGFVVLFDVPAGLFSVAASPQSGFTMTMPESPTAQTAATLAEIVVVEGEAPEVPVNVSFQNDVAPIFQLRGCVNCHDGGGIGKDLGGLHLNGEENKMYKELVTEMSPSYNVPRVDVLDPAKSLMLTMPSREEPADSHPNITFASPSDPDYQIILAWIAEGALLN
jgi:hypothetical protein